MPNQNPITEPSSFQKCMFRYLIPATLLVPLTFLVYAGTLGAGVLFQGDIIFFFVFHVFMLMAACYRNRMLDPKDYHLSQSTCILFVFYYVAFILMHFTFVSVALVDAAEPVLKFVRFFAVYLVAWILLEPNRHSPTAAMANESDERNAAEERLLDGSDLP